MPTAARLFAALSLVILAFIVSGQVMPLMPEGRAVGPWFTPVNMGVALVVGWVVLGGRAGRGSVSAINNGLTGMVVMMFWELFVHSTDEMVRLAMRNRYDGPLDAVLAIFHIGFDFAVVIFDSKVIITLVIGGVVAGLMTEYASRKWR